MKLFNGSKNTFTILAGAAALAIIPPACGGDDEGISPSGGRAGSTTGGTGGKSSSNGGTQNGTGGSRNTGGKGSATGGNTTTGGAETGTGGATATGGRETGTGGTTGGSKATGGANATGGVRNTGGTRPIPEGGEAGGGAAGEAGSAGEGGASGGGPTGTGGVSTGGASTGGASTGGASTGGASTGGASTGGADSGGVGNGGAGEAGAENGGAGGSSGALTCSDGCANFYVPITAAGSSTTVSYFGDANLAGKTVEVRVRARGYASGNGFIQLSLTGDADNGYAYFSAAGATYTLLTGDWQTLSLSVPAASLAGEYGGTFDPAHVLAVGVEAGLSGAPFAAINLEIDSITIADTTLGWTFTANAAGIEVNTNVGTVPGSAITWLPPAN